MQRHIVIADESYLATVGPVCALAHCIAHDVVALP